MMLKVGELAQRTGLTVRTLHHYDSIGLLTPSARSDSGYRLYQRDDIALREQMDTGTASTDPIAQQLSRQWFGLFRDLAGDSPETLQKLRHAHEKEPALLTGTWMDEAMITFMRNAMASLQQAQA